MDDLLDEDDTEAELAEATEYPLDTEGLHKGSRIAAEVIEHAFGIVRGTDAYRLRLLRVRDYIARRLRDRGELVTIVSQGHGLVILTDEEALDYNARRFEIETRQRERCFVRLGQIDRANLSEARRGTLERNVVAIGHRIQVDRQARREVKLRPNERQTPGLPESKR